MNGICYSCRKCDYKWQKDPGDFSIRCPWCNSHHIGVITKAMLDEWKNAEELGLKHLSLKYPSMPVIDENISCEVFKSYLSMGYFDSMPWADACKNALFLRESGMVAD